MNLKGQKISVIGGSSGMGLAAAQALAREDATVVIASRSREKLEAAKARIAGEVETASLDFTEGTAVKKFFEANGRIDHLVLAAAGPPAWGKFLELDPAALRKAFDTPAYDWMSEDEKQAFFKQMSGGLPVKRIGQPHEIAEAVLLLVGNGFITGAVLDVDGGARLT